jgi:two-component system, LytTR family, response regulator
MIRTILVDDEIDSIRVLTKLLTDYCPEVSIIGQADGVDTATELIRKTGPDLVFLDIEMTQGNAFDLLNRLMPVDFQVIFVTAFDNHAIRAFKYSAVDYLLKPVNIDELRNAVQRVTKPREKQVMNQMENFLADMSALKMSWQKIALPTLTGLLLVAVSDIIRLEAKGGYTLIHFSDKQPIMTTRGIKEYEDILPDVVFYRVHSSHIINMGKIQKYQRGRGGYVIMEDGSSVEVASRRREEFLTRLMK